MILFYITYLYVCIKLICVIKLFENLLAENRLLFIPNIISYRVCLKHDLFRYRRKSKWVTQNMTL